MPERLSYDEAMLFSSTRLKVQDPELKQGKVEMFQVKTNVGMVERPWGVEGGFAVVYKFRTSSGLFRALRCFRVPMEADTQSRYEQIGPYFHAHANAITAGFKYYDNGIVVKEQDKSQIYPIIEMDWIDGVTLIEKIDELCQKRDQIALRNLCEQWSIILRTLQKASIAHGDLAGPNIMVHSDGRLVLIDYDGVYIPSFVGKHLVLLGQPDYQHPKMSQRKFDEHMDAFSALVIYIALLSLALRPELWDIYTIRNNGKLIETNLLFTQRDFQDPQNSQLSQELENLGDPQISQLVQELKRSCSAPADQVRFPFHLLETDPREKRAIESLKQAIAAEDDEQIVRLWTPDYVKYQDAQALIPRVQLAQQRVNLLASWRTVLKSGPIAQIVAGYDSILDQCKNVTRTERNLLAQAQQFLQSYNQNDDDALLDAADALQQLGMVNFTPPEEQRITQAREQKKDLLQTRTALQGKNIDTIAAAYDPFQRIQQHLTQQELDLVELAYTFAQAYNKRDDAALLAAHAAIEASPYRNDLQPSQKEEQYLSLLLHRKDALTRIRAALDSKIASRISTAYDSILNGSKELTAQEHERIKRARQFAEAIRDQDDDKLVILYETIQNSPDASLLIFTPDEELRVQQARQRIVVLNQFLQELKSRQPRRIAAFYYHKDNYPLLSKMKNVTTAQHEQAQLARNMVQSLDKRSEDAIFSAYQALIQSPHKDAFEFTQDELRLMQEIYTRKIALARFLQILSKGIAQEINTTYQQLAADVRAQLTPAQLNEAKSAELYITLYSRLQAAIQTNNAKETRRLYRQIEHHPMKSITAEEQLSINNALKSEHVERLLNSQDDRQAIKAAKEHLRKGGAGLDELHPQLSRATRRFVKACELDAVFAFIKKDRHNIHHLIVSWSWPNEIEDAVIIYSAYEKPSAFEKLDDIKGCAWRYVIRRSHERDKQEEIPLDQAYMSLYVRVCALVRDDWEDSTLSGGNKLYYLSSGRTGKAVIHSNPI